MRFLFFNSKKLFLNSFLLQTKNEFKLLTTSSLKFVQNNKIDDCNQSYRTDFCGDLNLNHVGKSVSLCGWLQRRRGANFIILRDLKGIGQVLLKSDQFPKSFVDKLSHESVLCVRGIVKSRPEGQANLNMSSGDIEIECNELIILNETKLKLPFELNKYNLANESLRMQYRYLGDFIFIIFKLIFNKFYIFFSKRFAIQ
jgi:aspartyl/asparaginyl-tRNA synthetase